MTGSGIEVKDNGVNIAALHRRRRRDGVHRRAELEPRLRASSASRSAPASTVPGVHEPRTTPAPTTTSTAGWTATRSASCGSADATRSTGRAGVRGTHLPDRAVRAVQAGGERAAGQHRHRSVTSSSRAIRDVLVEAAVDQLRPDAQAVTAAARSGSTARYAASATRASGLSPSTPRSTSAASTAPAPERSSTAGAQDSSGQRSPAATTVIGGLAVEVAGDGGAAAQAGGDYRRPGRPGRRAGGDRGTVRAGQHQPVDALGGGRSAGDRLRPRRGAGPRAAPIAIVVLMRVGELRRARRPSRRKGWTAIPRSTPTHTAVVNDSTSTTTAYAASSAEAVAPVGPHSNRTGYAACRCAPLISMAVASHTKLALTS